MAIVDNLIRLDGQLLSKEIQLYENDPLRRIYSDWLWTNRCRLLNLALFKAGDSHLQVRRGGIQLVGIVEKILSGKYDFGEHHLEEPLFEQEEVKKYEYSAVTSSLPIVYKYAQALVSARFAQEYPEITHEVSSTIIVI